MGRSFVAASKYRRAYCQMPKQGLQPPPVVLELARKHALPFGCIEFWRARGDVVSVSLAKSDVEISEKRVDVVRYVLDREGIAYG